MMEKIISRIWKFISWWFSNIVTFTSTALESSLPIFGITYDDVDDNDDNNDDDLGGEGGHNKYRVCIINNLPGCQKELHDLSRKYTELGYQVDYFENVTTLKTLIESIATLKKKR